MMTELWEQEVRNHGLLDKPHQVVPMSIFWLLPQYILMGMMEVFLILGQLELYYKEAPECMRSLGNVLFLANMGAGNFWASGMVKFVRVITGRKSHLQQWIVNENINRCRLDYFYGFLAMQMAFVACLYTVVAQRFQHQKAIQKIINVCNASCKVGDCGLVNCKSIEEYPTAGHGFHVKEGTQA